VPAPFAVATALVVALSPPEGAQGREYVGVTVIDAPAVVLEASESASPGPVAGSSASEVEAVEAVEPVEDPPPVEVEDDPFFDDEDDFADDDYDPLRDSPEAIQAKGWVRSGIVFSVVGGVLAVGGVLMALSDPSDLVAGNGGQKLARDRAAQAMGIPGGVLLAGGLAMIVVGKRQKKRLGASVQALRRGAGVGMTLRF